MRRQSRRMCPYRTARKRWRAIVREPDSTVPNRPRQDRPRWSTATGKVLRRWKNDRAKEIESRFTQRFLAFGQLRAAVVPILRRNGQIFDSYGPYSDDPYDAERQNLWTRFEGEIACNNKRLVLLLERNKELLHPENQEIVDKFFMHASEFISTRGDTPVSRKHLFPCELLSVFGLNQNEDIGLPPSVAALQNFISHLIHKNRFVHCNWIPRKHSPTSTMQER